MMTLQDILKIAGGTISNNWFVIIIILSLIQISPLKLNPWSWIGKWIAKITGLKDVSDKVDKLETKIDNLEDKVDKNEAVTSRVRILRFGDELRSGVDHSKESYDQVLSDITHYSQYCTDHPRFENDKTVLTTQIIKESYHNRYLKEIAE